MASARRRPRSAPEKLEEAARGHPRASTHLAFRPLDRSIRVDCGSQMDRIGQDQAWRVVIGASKVLSGVDDAAKRPSEGWVSADPSTAIRCLRTVNQATQHVGDFDLSDCAALRATFMQTIAGFIETSIESWGAESQTQLLKRWLSMYFSSVRL